MKTTEEKEDQKYQYHPDIPSLIARLSSRDTVDPDWVFARLLSDEPKESEKSYVPSNWNADLPNP